MARKTLCPKNVPHLASLAWNSCHNLSCEIKALSILQGSSPEEAGSSTAFHSQVSISNHDKKHFNSEASLPPTRNLQSLYVTTRAASSEQLQPHRCAPNPLRSCAAGPHLLDSLAPSCGAHKSAYCIVPKWPYTTWQTYFPHANPPLHWPF